jgi:hypothetical protein
MYIHTYIQVNVVCYSSYLSNRDEQDFMDVFNELKVCMYACMYIYIYIYIYIHTYICITS